MLTEDISASVVSGQSVRLTIQGSRFKTRLRSINFSGRKNPEHKTSGRDFKPWVPSLICQARSRTSTLTK